LEILGILVCLSFIILGSTALRLIKPNTTSEMIAWQEFASSHQLQFMARADDPDHAIITGTLQDCFFFLKSAQEETGTLYTFISMRGHHFNFDETNRDYLRVFAQCGEMLRVKGILEADSDGKRVSYKESGIITDSEYLVSVVNTLSSLVKICPNIVDLGGEAIPELHQIAIRAKILQKVIDELLVGISKNSKQRWSANVLKLWCPHCLAHYDQRWVNQPPLKRVNYFGCRKCGQSRHSFEFEGKMVVVLDDETSIEQSQQDGELRVNWQQRRSLFDFDEIEIIRATDEDVERFAMQVGNDTDKVQKSRYGEMRCVVLANSQLSENSMRVLKRVFSKLEIREPQSNSGHLSSNEPANKSL